MRRTLQWFVVLSLVLVSVVTPYLAGAQDDQKFPILLSTGIRTTTCVPHPGSEDT